MFSWNTFPYSDFNKVNLDWVCRQISACGTFWTCSDASLVIDPDLGTGVSFYMEDMTGPAGDAEPKQGDAVFYSLGGITYCAFIDDVVGAGCGNPEFLSFRIYRMTGPQGEPGGGGTGLTEDVKQALLQLAQKVAYIDANGADYYQDLYDALYEVEPPATLVSIDAVYTQSGTVYDTDSLDSLKTDLVVTATYSDTTTAVIPAADYTLSGSLTVGTSSITVTYGGVTDSFTVTVTENPAPPVTLVSIEAVYTQSGTVYDTDSLDSLKTDLVVTATYSDTSTAVIPAADYTLSGSLTVGTSTITVSYGGQTETFTVTVSPSISYVTSGLFAYWDAIDNQGTGTHNPTATTWVDLINGHTWTAMKTDGTQTWSWSADSLNFTGSGNTSGKNTFQCPRPNVGLRTLEIVFTPISQIGCVGEFTTDLTGITDSTTQAVGVFPADNTVTSIAVQNGYEVTDITTIESISATYDSSYAAVKFFKNAVEITSQGSSHSFKYHFYSDMILGSQNNSSNLGYGFSGTIHAIRMYNRELTDAEIAQNYAVDVQRFGL